MQRENRPDHEQANKKQRAIMGGRNLPAPVTIAPYSYGKGIHSIGLMFRVGRIFRVDKNSGNGGHQTVQKSAEGVKIHVAEKIPRKTKSIHPAVLE